MKAGRKPILLETSSNKIKTNNRTKPGGSAYYTISQGVITPGRINERNTL